MDISFIHICVFVIFPILNAVTNLQVVSSKLSRDEDYSKALRGPLYSRIREALSSLEESRSLEEKKLNGHASNLSEERLTKNKMNDLKLVDMNQKVDNDHLASEAAPDDAHVTGGNTFGEIEEMQSEKSMIEEVESEESQIEEIESEKSKIEEVESKQNKRLDNQPSNIIAERFYLNGKRNMFISSEVEQAIGTLEKAILRVRQNRLNAEMQSSCFTNEVSPKENDGGNPKSLEVEVHSSGEHFSEVPKKEDTGRTLTTPLRNSTAIQNIRYYLYCVHHTRCFGVQSKSYTLSYIIADFWLGLWVPNFSYLLFVLILCSKICIVDHEKIYYLGWELHS